MPMLAFRERDRALPRSVPHIEGTDLTVGQLTIEAALGRSVDWIAYEYRQEPDAVRAALAGAREWGPSPYVRAMLTDSGRDPDRTARLLGRFGPARNYSNVRLRSTGRGVGLVLWALEAGYSRNAVVSDDLCTRVDVEAAVRFAELLVDPPRPDRAAPGRRTTPPQVVSDPRILAGVPVVAGTEISVGLVRGLTEAGWSAETLCDRFGLMPGEVAVALADPRYAPWRTAMLADHPGVDRRPGKCGGVPCMAGHRLTVAFVVEQVEAYGGIDAFIEDFDHLRREQVEACLAYAASGAPWAGD